MNKLNPHTLFQIFEQGDEEVYKEHGQEDILDNPFVLMNMVTRGLENYDLMRILYLRNYKEQFERVEHSIKDKYYNKLYGYLQRIDIDSADGVYAIGDSYERHSAQRALQTLLDHYEDKEQYERCSIVVKYIQMLLLEEAKLYIK
tara:strand:- start:317 stop:751 length:435 start_codon:yes stop_codon:yes gene_type:complete